VTAPDRTDRARMALDVRIADAARNLIEAVQVEKPKRGENGERLVSVVVPVALLDCLRIQIGAWEALNDSIGGDA
jgi:hypothetical protein